MDKMQDFTHKWANVEGKVAPYTASETKEKLDLQAKELREFINGMIDVLASIQGASNIGLTDRISNPTTVLAELKRLQQYDFEQMVQVNANAEIVTARNGFTTLDERLDDNDTKRNTATTNLSNLTTDYNIFKGSKGNANGLASLDTNGKVTQTQINGKIDVIFSNSTSGVTTINNIDLSKYRYIEITLAGYDDTVQSNDYLKFNGVTVIDIPYSTGIYNEAYTCIIDNQGGCIHSKATGYTYTSETDPTQLTFAQALMNKKTITTLTILPLNSISIKSGGATLNILGYR